MRKKWISLMLAALLLITASACSQTSKAPAAETPAVTAAPDPPATQEPAPTPVEVIPTQEPAPTPDELKAEALNAYAAVLDKYRSALNEKWGGERLIEEDMSLLCLYNYEGTPLENVGYALLDLNNDGVYELLIGSLQQDEFTQNMIYDLYALQDGAVTHVFSAQERDRFYLCRDEAAENLYLIANTGSNGAAQSGWFYLVWDGAALGVVQAVSYDATVNADAPWFMGYDYDWDVSADTPIDEETARSIIASYEAIYTAVELVPFSA